MTESFRTNLNERDFDSNLSNAFKQFHQIIFHSGAIYLFDMFKHNNTIVTRANKFEWKQVRELMSFSECE